MMLKNTVDQIRFWNPVAMVSLGLILIFCSCMGFAWARWPSGFTGLLKTIWDLWGQLLPW